MNILLDSPTLQAVQNLKVPFCTKTATALLLLYFVLSFYFKHSTLILSSAPQIDSYVKNLFPSSALDVLPSNSSESIVPALYY